MKLDLPSPSVEGVSTSVTERVTSKTELYVFRQLDIPELLHGFTVAAARGILNS